MAKRVGHVGLRHLKGALRGANVNRRG
jgi:hypothetical protein